MTVTPDAGHEGNVTVTVPAGVASDTANLGNAAGSQAFAVDTKAPALVASAARSWTARR